MMFVTGSAHQPRKASNTAPPVWTPLASATTRPALVRTAQECAKDSMRAMSSVSCEARSLLTRWGDQKGLLAFYLLNLERLSEGRPAEAVPDAEVHYGP